MPPPFDIQRTSSGYGWDVIDVRTGAVVRVNGIRQAGMPLDDADDLADLLNRLEREKPERPS